MHERGMLEWIEHDEIGRIVDRSDQDMPSPAAADKPRGASGPTMGLERY